MPKNCFIRVELGSFKHTIVFEKKIIRCGLKKICVLEELWGLKKAIKLKKFYSIENSSEI